MTTRFTAAVTLPLFAVLLLAGCASAAPVPIEVPADSAPSVDEADEALAAEIDACLALDGVDIAALLGESVGEVQIGSTCRISPEDDMSAASITLSVFETGGEQSIANQRGLLTVTSEPDLGDEAFLADTALAKGLDVRVGDQHISLRVHRQDGGPATDAELIAVGEAALANLGW